MIRGLYSSAWSMLANNKKMDVITNNIANASTTGYKKDTVVLESFPALLTKRLSYNKVSDTSGNTIGTMEHSSDVGEVFTYFNQGQLIQTNNKLDMAIKDSPTTFFAIGVLEPNGDIREMYTRDGSFKINANGMLVTSEGYPVLGENGFIMLESDDFMVERDGTIVQNGDRVARLLLRTFSDTLVLRKTGSGLFETEGEFELVDFNGSIVQGSLEQSNVNIVREMVDMISVMRVYEANQKAIQTQDSTLEKTVNEIGLVR